MSILKILAVVTPLALSSAAMAAPAPFTDAQYIAASRCEALMSSAALGRQDTRGVDAMLRAESGSRMSQVIDMADEARADAARAASHPGAYARAALIAERDGACRAYAGSGPVASAATASGRNRNN